MHLDVICLHYLKEPGKCSKKKKQRFKESGKEVEIEAPKAIAAHESQPLTAIRIYESPEPRLSQF